MPLSNPVKPTFASVVTGTAVAASGLTGAASQSRLVGGNASGAPASGTFAVGDQVTNADGTVYVCTVAGTPGTWVQVGIPSYGTPVNIDASLTSLSAGSLTTVARADHVHTVSNAAILIYATTIGTAAATISISGFPSTYRHLWLQVVSKSTYGGAYDYWSMRMNNDTASNYYWNGATATSIALANVVGATFASGTPPFVGADVWVPRYSVAERHAVHSRCLTSSDANFNLTTNQYGGIYAPATSITSIQLIMASGNFAVGSSVLLWGYG